jgi:hypothetical protein
MSNATTTPKIKREDLRLAFFPSFKEFEKACLLFSEDKEFEKILWDHSPAPLSFITTAEAIFLLKRKGIKFFHVAEPIAEEDITQQQRKFLETDRAVWAHSCFLGIVDATFFLERVSFGVDKDGHYVKTQKT